MSDSEGSGRYQDTTFGLGWTAGVTSMLGVIYLAKGSWVGILPLMAFACIVGMYLTGYRSLHTDS